MIIDTSNHSADNITQGQFTHLINFINERIHKLLEDKKYLAYCLLKEDIAYKNIQEAFGPVLACL